MKNNKENLYLMLDIETLGTKPGCAVLSVAFKSFTPNPLETPIENIEIVMHIDLLSSILNGMKIEEGTANWWAVQSDNVKYQISKGAQTSGTFTDVFNDIYAILTELCVNYNVYIFGRGIGTFDLPILEACMKTAIGDTYKTPWPYWAPMDVRSIFNFAQFIGYIPPKTITEHDALADVIKQIGEIHDSYKYFSK